MLIKNASVVSPGGVAKQDVLFDEHSGKIVAVAPEIVKPGEEYLDAEGLYLLAGATDMHVHFRDPGATQKEDFLTGSAAALSGGVTTVCDMPNNIPLIDSEPALANKLSIAQSKSVCDYALYLAASNSNAQTAQKTWDEGKIAGVKIFMGPTTGAPANFPQDLFSTYSGIACVHAEDAATLEQLDYKYRRDLGNLATCAYHNTIRPPQAAQIAVTQAIEAAGTTGRLHVCHITTSAEVELVAKAKATGAKVTCEVTPHHLFLTEKDATKKGNVLKVNPPLRSEQDVKALWNGIADGTIDCIASDHAPHMHEEKTKNYWSAPSGVPGVETMLPLLLDAAARGRLTLARVAELACANPAAIMGFTTKGTVEPGKDADLVLVDFSKEKTVGNNGIYSKCGWTPFEGKRLKGAIENVFLRGKLVFDGRHVVALRGSGKRLSHLPG